MRKSGCLLLTSALIMVGASASLPQATGTISGRVRVFRSRTSANVVVYLEKVGNNKFDPPAKHVIMDQMNKIFIPHVLPIVKGTTVDFPNSDKVRHNVYSPAGSTKRFNLGTYPAGITKTMRFEKSGIVPLRCNVHTEMSAFILVFENPYFAQTNRRGRFMIKNVPPGRYTLKTWHERMASVSQEITVEAGKTVQVSLDLKKRQSSAYR